MVSHDREFLEALDPTHVLVVRDGAAVLQERGLLDKDWDDEFTYRQVTHRLEH